MGTPAPPLAPLATHLASLGTGTNLSGKNMFKLITDENPLNIIQFEYQIRDQEDNYSGGYIYMSDVSFILNGTDYEYSVPVPADSPGLNYVVNPSKQIRFRYWTQGSTILASEWSVGYLKFLNAPIKPEFSNSFVLYRNQSNNDDDFLILELSESSRTAYTNPNNEDGVNLANGPIKFLAVYGFPDNLGNEVWKASPLTQPSINGYVRVELNDDVLSGSQVDVTVFAVYEFYDEEDGPFYTISEISDMMSSMPPSMEDLEPSLNPFNYVINVLSTTETTVSQGTSSLYDVDNKMVELTWTSPASDVVNPVNHYEVQAKVVAGDNLFVRILNNIDASSRGYRLSEATVVAALQAEGQLSADVYPSYGSKLEYRVVAKYPDDVNSSSTPQEVTVGQLSDALPSDAITVSSHFAKTINELVYSASYDISAILDNLGSQVSNATAIQTQLVRVPKNGDPSEVLTTDSIDLNLSLPQTLYRQRVVYDVGTNVTLFENITENDFQVVAWVVNDIASNKEIYLDSSLDPNNVLSQTVSAGWNEVTKSTTLSSKGLIFNLTVDNENKLFHFIALHREPLENVVVTKVDAEGGLVQGKPLTAETFNVRRVENDNLYLESNAPQELLNRLEHTYSGSYLTRVEGNFSVLFDNVDVPSTFSVAYANGNRLTTGFVNNNVFGGLTVSDEDMLTWEGSAP